MRTSPEKQFEPDIEAVLDRYANPRTPNKKIPNLKVAKLIRAFAEALMEVLDATEGVKSAVASKLEGQCAPYEVEPRYNGHEGSSSSLSLGEVRQEILVPLVIYIQTVIDQHNRHSRPSIRAIDPLTVTYDPHRLGN